MSDIVKISACMIVKNEEDMLAGALESIQGADEIIVCDTGSSDKTVEIAKRYTDKVFTDFKWCDDFAKARNHAASKATGDWILVIDADERLQPGGMDLIREAAKKAIQAISCEIISMGDDQGRQSFRNIRAYLKSPNIYWQKPIHNHLNVPADAHCEARIVFGYSPAHRNDPNRAMRILTQYVKDNPKSARERYYLAREYSYRRDHKKVVQEIDEYLPLSRNKAERADAYLMKARSLWQLKMGDEARESCMKAIVINANFREAVLFMAEMSWRKNADTWRAFAEHCTNEGVLFVKSDEPGRE